MEFLTKIWNILEKYIYILHIYICIYIYVPSSSGLLYISVYICGMYAVQLQVTEILNGTLIATRLQNVMLLTGDGLLIGFAALAVKLVYIII